MIKKMIIKKTLIATLALLTLGLFYIFKEDNNTLNIQEKLEYVDNEVSLHDIFLLDSNNYLALTHVVVNESKTELLAKELLDILIKDGKGESKIPSGFKSIIPSNTEIKNIVYKENVLKLDFSKELLDVNKEIEEKVIESIIYTMTSIKEVNKVLIYVEGEILSKLPKNNLILPSSFDRKYGINKKYDITSITDITPVTIYYINKYNDDYYYVPVTCYMNDKSNKIKIIIDELKYNHNDLMSFLDANTKLISAKEENNIMTLEFSNDIYSINDEILKEVVDTITLSVLDNYDVDEVVFNIQK